MQAVNSAPLSNMMSSLRRAILIRLLLAPSRRPRIDAGALECMEFVYDVGLSSGNIGERRWVQLSADEPSQQLEIGILLIGNLTDCRRCTAANEQGDRKSVV